MADELGKVLIKELDDAHANITDENITNISQQDVLPFYHVEQTTLAQGTYKTTFKKLQKHLEGKISLSSLQGNLSISRLDDIDQLSSLIEIGPENLKDDFVLDVAKGGTGTTSIESIKDKLGINLTALNAVSKDDIIDQAHGGTGNSNGTITFSQISDKGTYIYDATLTRTKNTVLAAPNGSNGSATFRSLVANDLPIVPITKGGTGASTAAAGFTALSGYTLQCGTNNTTDTWVPVFKNSIIQHRTIPTCYNTSPLAMANGGTGATTRIQAIKNLLSQHVASPNSVFALTNGHANCGWTTIAELRTSLGLKNLLTVVTATTGYAYYSAGAGITVNANFTVPSGYSVLGIMNIVCQGSDGNNLWGVITNSWTSGNTAWGQGRNTASGTAYFRFAFNILCIRNT